MKPIYAAYTHEVYANLRPLHAVWEPTQRIRLGDVGFLDGRAFRRQTNLRDCGIGFQERSQEARPNLIFGSRGTTELQLKPAVHNASGVLAQRASLELKFSSAGAVFFHLAACASASIENQVELGREVLTCFDRRNWNPDWVVVTEVIGAGATTLSIAGESGANLQLEAAVTTPVIDLQSAALRFEFRKGSKIDFQLISAAGLQPLIGLSKMRRPWFTDPKFGPSLIGGQEDNHDEWSFGTVD